MKPYRASDGYWWHGDTKLSIQTERQLFDMLGMTWLEPHQRTEDAYRMMFEVSKHRWGDMPPLAKVEAVEEVVQPKLF